MMPMLKYIIQNLTLIIDKYQICLKKHVFSIFLRLISKISNNHHRGHNFISKLERILINYKKIIIQNFTNMEIFKIFKGNKRILLFLLEEKIIIMEKDIVEKFFTNKYRNAEYPKYFSPEIKPFMDFFLFTKNHWDNQIMTELPQNFNELRKIGENESFICELIRNDSIDEFISYVNKNNISLKSIISPSIFETNQFLLKKKIDMTLIKYAVFFGSFQIIKYMQLSGVVLNPELCIYSIHGKNAEIIHLLEENISVVSDRNDNKNFYGKYIDESIKSYHNDIANYILDNYLPIEERKSSNFLNQCFKSSNLLLLQNELNYEDTLFYLCQYDYYFLLKLLLKDDGIDVNKILVKKIQYNFIIIFQFNSKITFLMQFKIIYFNGIVI